MSDLDDIITDVPVFSDQSNGPVWIDSKNKLSDLIDVLSVQEIVAVDTEGDSLYSYFPKVCLIQFSTADTDYLVDPFEIDVSRLSDFFKDPSIQKVFHAAEYDILNLKRDYQIEFANLFDTMWAAKILGWETYGLAPILEEQFGIKLDKRFQRYNWGIRPLSKEAVDYAYQDTHYLLALRNVQFMALKDQNCLEEAAEIFERQTNLTPHTRVFNPHDFWKLKGCHELDASNQSVLFELFSIRDEIARALDKPIFKVIADQVLISVASVCPETKRQLRKIKGFNRQLLAPYEDVILTTIQKGKGMLPPKKQYRSKSCDSGMMPRYEAIRNWRNSVAANRGVAADVIVANHILKDIAQSNPKTVMELAKLGALGKWQCNAYGESIIEELLKVN